MAALTPSFASDMEVATFPKFQLNKDLLIFFPDPHEGGAGPSTWHYEIYDVAGAAIVASGSLVYPTNGNAIKINLDDAVYAVDKLYRVRIQNGALATIDTYYFTCYDTAFGTVGPINTATINAYIRRLAGLLGMNAVVEHDTIDMGIPTDTTITIYDQDPANSGAVALYEYRQIKVLDEAHRVIAEISAAQP